KSIIKLGNERLFFFFLKQINNKQSGTDIQKDYKTQIYNQVQQKQWEQMSPQIIQHHQQIRKIYQEQNYNIQYQQLKIYKNISHLKFKYKTIKEQEDVLDLPISNLLLGQSLQCVMKDGIKYNQICKILLIKLMELIIWKLFEFKYMQIVESEESILLIECIRKKNYLLNLSFFT
ncbi:hypothetical protein IMG5_040370, partial [Ichthyophthirius multifiliis]